MKRVVISEDLRESEMHPTHLFDKYLEITENELKKLFKKWNFYNTACPACNSRDKNKEFEKFGMNYYQCQKCKTLFVNPRPREQDISGYYKNSKAIDYWNNTFYKETLKKRKKVIFRPRAEWVSNITNRYFEKPSLIVDVKSKYNEFIYELNRLNEFKEKILIDPLVEIKASIEDDKNIKIINKNIQDIEDNSYSANAITAFEVVDRLSNPNDFVKKINSLLVKNGVLFLTTSSISGFDLQVLWEKSKSIYPIDHINLFSIEGITKLLNNNGFEILECSTVGLLDVEIVKNYIKNNPDADIPRFISYLLKYRNQGAHKALQDFLQRFNLSSHLRIAAQKI